MWPFKTRAEPPTTSAESEDVLLRAALTDEAVTINQAMNIPAFAACVNKISETISLIPIRLYRREGDKLTEIKDDIRTRLLNVDTGDTLDAVQFKRAVVRDYLTGQGGYVYLDRTGNRIKALRYVKENNVSFFYNPDPIFRDYDISVSGRRYKPYQFLKVLRNTENGWSGRSVIAENAEVLAVAYNSLRYERNLVQTGGNKKGFLRAPKRLTEDAIRALKNAWRRMYSNNSENVVVLNDGIEFQEASNTSVEMQMNENKRTNSDEICKLFGIPPSLISGSPTEQDRVNFVDLCLNPILAEIENALNRDLLLENEKKTLYFVADTSELTKGDIEKRFRAYETASRSGFMQIDEIRLKENLPGLGLDFVKLGLQDVLYDPATKQFYMPNMNQTGGLGENKTKEGEKIEN